MSEARGRATILRGEAANRVTSATPSLDVFEAVNLNTRRLSPVEKTEKEHQSGFEQGFAEGLDAARAAVEEATADANKRVRRALAALCEAVNDFDTRETTALADVEDAVVAGAIALAREILGRELAVMADPGAEAIARGLKFAPERGKVLARLHPEDLATLSTDSVSTSTRTVTVVADPSVEPGGCLVDVGNTRIDAQLGTALARARVAMAVPTESLPTPAEIAEAVSAQETPSAADGNSQTAVVAGRDNATSRTTASEAPLV